MRKVLLMFAALLLITACSNKTAIEDKDASAEEKQEEETEILFDRDHDIMLLSNDDLEITLTKSRQERIEKVQDFMKLKFKFKNKENRSYEFYFDEIQLDGETYKITNISSTDTEIKGDEELEVIAIVDSLDEISFGEYIGGEIVYVDYEGNRNEIEFSEYINE